MIVHTRRRFTWILLMCLAIAGGCAAQKDARMMQFEATARAYERSLRWSEFAKAYALTGKDDVATFDAARLQHIRVHSYDKKTGLLVNEEVSEISQVVEISYVHIDNMSERHLIDRQTWVYSEKRGNWTLRSGFPKFP
jgi:hypothetical protein